MRVKIMLFISLVVLVGMWVMTKPDEKIRLIFCDVGQGDGILITQNNFQMVVDTGPQNKKMLQCLEKNMPFWDKKIEIVIITHEDQDHSGGLKEVKSFFEIEKLYGMKSIDEQNIYTDYLQYGDLIESGLIKFEVLNPNEIGEEKNVGSIVGLLSFNQFKVLLMGDVTAEVEQRLVWRKLVGPIDVLKVAHHGSKEATSIELLEATTPKEAVISVGKNNKFGHPTQEILNRLEERGIKIKRTDIEGEVHVLDVIENIDN